MVRSNDLPVPRHLVTRLALPQHRPSSQPSPLGLAAYYRAQARLYNLFRLL